MIQHSPVEIAIRASATLTSSYVYTTGVAAGKGRDQIAVLVNYTKGDETSMEFLIQFSDTLAFTNAYSKIYKNTGGDGKVLPKVEYFQWTASAKHAIFTPSAGLFFRIGAKATGGTPTGTLAVKARFDTVSKGA